jgi:hypothetical protein
MGLRERLTRVTQFFQRAKTEGRQRRDDDERAESLAPSSEDQSAQRDARRRANMSAEDREWEQASLQRDRDRQAARRQANLEDTP